MFTSPSSSQLSGVDLYQQLLNLSDKPSQKKLISQADPDQLVSLFRSASFEADDTPKFFVWGSKRAKYLKNHKMLSEEQLCVVSQRISTALTRLGNLSVFQLLGKIAGRNDQFSVQIKPVDEVLNIDRATLYIKALAIFNGHKNVNISFGPGYFWSMELMKDFATKNERYLTELSLRIEVDDERLSDLLFHCYNLRSLTVASSKISGESLEKIIHPEKLEKLDLAECPSLSPDLSLKKFAYLKSLVISQLAASHLLPVHPRDGVTYAKVSSGCTVQILP
ncbi:MAG: hypothetical protein ACHQUC_03970 [Chlamydiales bacterium]